MVAGFAWVVQCRRVLRCFPSERVLLFANDEQYPMTLRQPNLLPDGVLFRMRDVQAIRDLAREPATLGLVYGSRRRQLVGCATQIDRLADDAIELIERAHR